MRKIAVLGLGRFGMELARQLGQGTAEVIAIDSDARLVTEVKDDVAISVRLDVRDEQAMEAHDLGDVDVSVVAIGEDFESSLLCTVLLKRLGCKQIVCRAQSPVHAEIFRQVGAHEVIQPEIETARALARRLANPSVKDFLPLAPGFSLVELVAPKNFRGKTLREIDLRNHFGVNLVAVKKPIEVEENGEKKVAQVINSIPHADDQIDEGDVLVLVGANADLGKLPKE
jgi:trk system potassium uptake protein TrkA